jgi:hypothetical protein
MRILKKIGCVLYNAFVKLLENALSKKFLVFITATVLLVCGYLPANLWLPVALAVLGVVSALDYKNGTTTLHERTPAGTDGPPPEGPPDIP